VIKVKLKNISKIIGGTVSAMMIAASIPAVAYAADQQTRGNIGGYDYEMWNQNGQGQASMNPGAGSFTCSWSNIENFLARMGKNYDSQKKNYKAFGNIVLTYDLEYTPRGNSYMCVYGWTRNPLMEYYIVEGWGDWRPPGNDGERKGNVTLNGNTYEIAKTMRYNQPSLDGTATFPQYWSIRTTSGSANNQTNYMKGTIDVSKHFEAWEKAGLDMSGTLYEVSLNIEGYRSNGQANVKSVTVTEGAGGGGGQQSNDWGGQQQSNDWGGQQQNNDWNNWGQQNNDWNNWGGQQNNDWNNWGQQNQGWDWNNQGQQQNNDWNNWGQQNQGWDWNNQGQQQNNDWNNWGQQNQGWDWNNQNNNQWNGVVNNDWNNNNQWNQNQGWDWNNQNNNQWNQNQNQGWDWNNQNNNQWNQNQGWDWNNQGQQNQGWDWNNQNNNQWNGVVNNDWNNNNQWNQNQGWDWNNQNNNQWNQNNDWNNNNQWNQNQGWDWNNQGQQNNDWNNWGQQNNDWNNWGNQNQGWDWNNQNNNQWNGVTNNDWNQNNDWNNWGGQQNNDWNQGQQNNGGQPQGGGVQAGKKLCAISFDDGASATSKSDPGYRIIDALIKNNMTATFFIVSDWIKTNDQVKYEYQNGMEVANHTKSHQSLGSLGSQQIRSEWEQCNSKLKSIIGAEPSHLMRLPYLDGGGQVKSALYDVPLISCAIDTQDWNGASKDQIVNTIKQAAQNGSLEGAIVLCHENYAATAAAMEEVLPWLAQNGYQNVSISEMAAAKGKTLAGGQIHTRV